jgi:NAD(P)H-flavin reductase
MRWQGYFDLVIKRYPEGNVSNFMHKLQPGDTVTVKGPFLKV